MNKTATFTLTALLSSWSIVDAIEMCNPSPISVESPPPEKPNLRLPTSVSGYALLEYTVTEQGNVTNVELIQAYAPPEVPGLTASFALAAIAAVKNWKYEPVEASCRVRKKLSFSIEKGGA